MAKDIVFKEEVRASLKRGVDAVADAVKETIGARGGNVLYTNFLGEPEVTKDGVTVADDIFLDDPLENMAAQLLKKVAKKTNTQAGDGTTTATILAQAIVEEGHKNITVGANSILLKKGIDLATKEVVNYLSDVALTVKIGDKSLLGVATISANNDSELGSIIAKAYKKVGKDGVVVAKDSQTAETYSGIADGMEFDSGYISPYFINDQKKSLIKLKDASVIIIDEILSNNIQLSQILSKLLETDRFKNKPIFIVAEDIESEALATLIVNNRDTALKIAAVKSPKYGFNKIDFLEDLAALTGARVISKELGEGIEKVDESFFGIANTLTISSDKTSLSVENTNKSEIRRRVGIIKAKIEASNSETEKEDLQDRLSKLSDGVATIMVGAVTDTERNEKKLRVEDSINATKAALEEGVVEGGGVALLRANIFLKTVIIPSEERDIQLGWNILIDSLLSPIKAIIDNGGGISSDVVINEVIKSKAPIGYDIRKEEYVNMLKAGIIDPKKVTRCAIENASSIAGMIITINCALVDKSSKLLERNINDYKTEML